MMVDNEDSVRACGDNHSLALWVTPQAIRQAYSDAEDKDNPTLGMTDAQLVEVGYSILDGIYDEYRRLLDAAIADEIAEAVR